MKPRFVMTAFIVAVLVLHGVVSWLSPISYDDWDYLVWAAQHRHDPSWFASFFAKHYTLGPMMNYTLARVPIVHAIVTPLCGLAVVWGTFTIAMRRLPRFDAWADVIGVVVIAAFIWIAAPRCGLVMFHRPYTALWLYGTAATLWVLVPFRCGWRVRGGWIVLLAIGGLLAATSTRQLGIVLVAMTFYAARKQRASWIYIVLAAVVAGTALGFYRQSFDYRGLRPGFELSLVALNTQIFENGELISLVGGLVIVKLVVGTLWPQHRGEGLPDTSETLRWFGVWIAYIILALFGPKYVEASAFPGAVIVCIAAFPVVQWVMTSKPLRIVVLVLAIGINVIAWSMSLSIYVPFAQEYRERVATLRAAPKGSIPKIKPYSQIRPAFFAYGEDWSDAARRQYVAVGLYRLADIDFSPAFRRLEVNPKLEMKLVAEGVTPAQLSAAGSPDTWSGTLKAARQQFEYVRGNLKIDNPNALRLVVEGLPADVLRGRELVAATANLVPKITRRTADDESRHGIVVSPASLAKDYPEAYTVIDGKAAPVPFKRQRYMVTGMTSQLHAVVACNPTRCILVDAFIPSL